jgi:hypothetical protein
MSSPIPYRGKSDQQKPDNARNGTGVNSAQTPPVKDDLSGLAGDHCVEALLKIAVSEAVRNDRGDVHAQLQHHRHLVPSFVHLAAVDALYGEHVEDDLPPIHRRLIARNAEDGDLAAVAHVGNHVA